MKRVICFFFGHRPQTDGHKPYPDNRALRSCQRCGMRLALGCVLMLALATSAAAQCSADSERRHPRAR
jgi:hypothetical protein